MSYISVATNNGYTTLSGFVTTNNQTYRYYRFVGSNIDGTKTGTITFPKSTMIYFMIVGGGGSGGYNQYGAGAGGGGGIYYNSSTSHMASDLSFTIGTGGFNTNGGQTQILYGINSITTPGGNKGVSDYLGNGGAAMNSGSTDSSSTSGNTIIASGAGGKGNGARGGNGLQINTLNSTMTNILVGLGNYISSGGSGGVDFGTGIGGSASTGGGSGSGTVSQRNSTQIGGGGGGGSDSASSSAPKGGDGLVAIWFEVLNSSITISASSSFVDAFADFTITVTFTTPSVNVAGNGSFRLFDDEQTTYLSGSLPIPTSNTISCSSIGYKTLQCSFESNYPEYFTDSESNNVDITITPATQSAFTFSTFVSVYGSTVNLSSLVTGGTSGGSYSFTVNGSSINGTAYIFPSAASYSVKATKTVTNYYDLPKIQTITITPATQPGFTIYNRVYTKTELLNGPTSTFYFLWTEHANYNNPTYGYTLTISNEYTKYERAIPSLGETIRPYISTNRSSIVDLSGISSTTTITFTSMAAISNVVVYPVAKIIDNFNNSAIDISLSNHFNDTDNSYPYTSSIFNQNEVPLPDISFSNITGYSFSFKPMRISQYNTYYRILQENIFNGDDVVQASDLTPDTSYTILTNISYPQSSRFLYPSFQNYEKTFYISTRNESRIASLDITNIRAESIVMRISDVSNSSDISRVDISVMTTTNNNLIQFISLSNGQFPYTLSGLPMDTSFNIVTNHVYFGTGNTYDSSGLSFSTKKQSKVARIPGIVNDLVHRIDETGDNQKMNLFIKFGSSVGDPSYNTLYFKRLSDTFYTTYTIPQNVFEFDFSGTLTLPFEKNQRYSIYIRTTYNDGNFYDTATFDFSAIQQSVLNNNYLLDFSNSITLYSNGVYYTNPYFYTLTDGFMAYDMPRSSTNTIIRQPNNNEHGPVAILYHTSYPNSFSRLAQTISVNLEVKIYSFSFWYANVFESSSRPYYNALGTNKTENTVMFAVYLEDMASNSAIQNTRFLTSSSDTSWTRFDVSFSLNMKRNISTVNLVIERTEYEYNMLALMNIQFQQEPENNIDYSVALLRNVFGEESLLYNISVFIYGSPAYDTFTTATEYSVTIKYDNTNAYSFINTLFISNVLSSTVSSFNISGNTFIINSQSGFAIYPNQTYEMYVKTEIQSKSFYSQPVVFNAIPYQSPARIIYNISFGYYTLVDHYSRMHQTNLFAPYLDEDMYAVHLCFAPPFGDTNTFINTLHITNLSDSKSIEVNIPSSNSLFTFKGVDHTDISGLYLDTSYQIYISTLYTRSGNSFDTASFVFRIPDVSYTLVDY